MKEFLTKNKVGIMSMILILIAAALGADSGFAMSMAEAVEAPPSTEFKPDDKGGQTQQPGTGAAATTATATEFEEEEIDKSVALFRPFRFPLEYDIVNNCVQRKATTYHPKHYRSGSAELETTTTGSVVGSGSTYDNQKVTFTSSNCDNIEVLTTFSQVVAKGVPGYNEDKSEDGGDLIMYITKNDGDTATGLLLNPKAGGTTTIPGSTTLIVCAVAGSESQMIVPPDNFQPEPYEVYLQKKISNIVMTKEWMEQAKKADFDDTDLRNNALYNFKRKNARTHWLGKKKIFYVKAGENMANEAVYNEEGVLRQVNMLYSYNNGKIEATDMTAISKMQFTKYAVNDHARVYCGKNAIQRILDIDLTVHKNIKFEDVNVAGMTIRAWKNNFGTLEFVHDPTLDDIGYEDFMVVLDIQNAVRYVHREQRTDKQDMSKGTGEVREAEREIYSIIDCVALRGYNSILVGPAEKLAKARHISQNSKEVTSSATVPVEELYDNMIVYLTADDKGFKAGTLIQYDNSTKTWHEYAGELAA